MSSTDQAADLSKSIHADGVTTDRVLPSLLTSFVVAMMTVVMSVSFVALIFVGPLTIYTGEAVSVMLLTATVLGAVMVLYSSYAGMIAIPQDRVAPVFALIATSIIKHMKGAPPELIGVTLLASIATSTLIVGVVLWLLGAYRLGKIVRFTPYPVIGGFLAGSGWLLLTGSVRVVTGKPFSIYRIHEFIASGLFTTWLPCAIFGTVAYLAVRYLRHYLTLSLVTVGAGAAFYLWLPLTHHTIADARANDWIFGVPADIGLSHVRTFPTLMGADWTVVGAQYGSLVALLLISIVSILLNTSALELAADQDIDLNRELRAAGIGNVMCGFGGGMIGFQSLSLSMLPLGMGVRSRLVGLISAGACFGLLLFGSGLLAYIPRFMLGGILFYCGLTFLAQWVIDAYFRLIREDYFLVMLILAIVAVAGYLEGIGAGILIAILLFVMKYSSVNVISSALSGDNNHSSVDRSPPEARLLDQRGGQIHMLRLKGYIFFGSADNLFNTIRERFEDSRLPRLGYVILDFQHVSGLDTSGIVSISKLSRFAVKNRIQLLAASVPDSIDKNLRDVGLLKDGPGQITIFPDRDHATEFCEDIILRSELGEVRKEVGNLPVILNEFHPWRVDTSTLLGYMDRVEVEKDSFLVRQGEPSRELFFIESGRIKVMVKLDNGRTLRIRTMGGGTVVGEIGLYLNQPRVASVITEEPCVVYRLSAESLTRMEQENPALASAFNEFMVRVLAERVTQQNRALRALVD